MFEVALQWIEAGSLRSPSGLRSHGRGDLRGCCEPHRRAEPGRPGLASQPSAAPSLLALAAGLSTAFCLCAVRRAGGGGRGSAVSAKPRGRRRDLGRVACAGKWSSAEENRARRNELREQRMAAREAAIRKAERIRAGEVVDDADEAAAGSQPAAGRGPEEGRAQQRKELTAEDLAVQLEVQRRERRAKALAAREALKQKALEVRFDRQAAGERVWGGEEAAEDESDEDEEEDQEPEHAFLQAAEPVRKSNPYRSPPPTAEELEMRAVARRRAEEAKRAAEDAQWHDEQVRRQWTLGGSRTAANGFLRPSDHVPPRYYQGKRNQVEHRILRRREEEESREKYRDVEAERRKKALAGVELVRQQQQSEEAGDEPAAPRAQPSRTTPAFAADFAMSAMKMQAAAEEAKLRHPNAWAEAAQAAGAAPKQKRRTALKDAYRAVEEKMQAEEKARDSAQAFAEKLLDRRRERMLEKKKADVRRHGISSASGGRGRA
mmetsp:Transcript_56987/g.144638  ORF Transcript_56987/g.144638 Transcript_56987/m.144638 type:complete len:491 (+) Transcript_56987:54-1526(+)